MSATQTMKKAPDVGCHRLEGEDQTTNPQEGEPVMTIMNDTAVDSNPTRSSGIHPEIPQLEWANERVGEEFGCIVDRLCIDRAGFAITISQLHHPKPDGTIETLEPDVLLRWEQQHLDGSNTEDLCIPIADLPRLITALQATAEAIGAGR